MQTATLSMLTALTMSVPTNLIFDKGYTGNKWGDGIIDYLLLREWPPIICYIMGQLALEFADKVITVTALYIVIRIRKRTLKT